MTAHMAERRTAPQILTAQYRRLRAVHPINVLRWLRNGMLLSVAAASVLYLWVAVQAGHDIDAARRTRQAITDIQQARGTVRNAGEALSTAVDREDVTLTGTGSDYINQITQVHKYLTLAAENNAAGTEGAIEIQSVQGLLVTYLRLSENVARDYGRGKPLGEASLTYAAGGEENLLNTLNDLKGTEQRALSAQRGAWPLATGMFWWAMLGPVIAMLLLLVATAQVLARHFRRHVSRWLWGSLLTTAAAVVTVGLFNARDARELAADPWAGNPATMTIALLLFLAAGVQAYLAYRPRLDEYRFPPS